MDEMDEMNWLGEAKNGVHFLTPPNLEFEAHYMSTREKEKRLPNDEFVKSLPNVPKDHLHYNEWKLRKKSLKRLQNYLKSRKQHTLLEIGCGNGWLTQELAPLIHEIFGLDVTKAELEQAARCKQYSNSEYICCTDWSLLPMHTFDIILFSGSFQYFELTLEFWVQLERLLKENGEIHIIDTFFYTNDEADKAKERSKRYFSDLGEESSIHYYHHQMWDELPETYKVLFQPNRFLQKLKSESPFPWIVISKEALK